MNARERLKKFREGSVNVLRALVAEYMLSSKIPRTELMQKLALLPFKERHMKDEMKRQSEIRDRRAMRRYGINPDGKTIQRRLIRAIESTETARLRKAWPLKKTAAEWARNYVEVMLMTYSDGKIVPFSTPKLNYNETEIYFGGNKSRRAWGNALRPRKGVGYEFHLHLPPSHTFDIVDGHLVVFKRADRGQPEVQCTWFRNSTGLKPETHHGRLVTTDRERLFGFKYRYVVQEDRPVSRVIEGTYRVKKGGKR